MPVVNSSILGGFSTNNILSWKYELPSVLWQHPLGKQDLFGNQFPSQTLLQQSIGALFEETSEHKVIGNKCPEREWCES